MIEQLDKKFIQYLTKQVSLYNEINKIIIFYIT